MEIKGIKTSVKINRPVYDIEDLNTIANYTEPRFKCPRFCEGNVEENCKEWLKTFVPPVEWIYTYAWRKHVLYDLCAGIGQLFLHITQGLAYGILAGYEAINGIYTSFFPPMIYFIFGSSRHTSMGVSAIISLLTHTAIQRHNDIICDTHGAECEDGKYTAIQIGTALTFYIGIIQIVMWALRLGILTTVLSIPFINAFTSAAAWHIIATQFPELFGIDNKRTGGLYNFILIFYDFYKNFHLMNGATLIVSMICITMLILNNEFLQPWWDTKTKIPLPIEILLLIFGNIISYVANFPEDKIRIVGYIKVGLPLPLVPKFVLFSQVYINTIAIVLVSYAITMSWNITFAKQYRTLVDSNQELFAMGLSNVFGSFFECFPICGSLSRTILTVKLGGRTQFTSLVSLLLLFVLIVWMGPFFEHLPRAILAAVVLSSLRHVLIQMRDVKKYWRMSKLDFSIWIVTFTSSIILDIDYGLYVGITYSIIVLIITTFSPRIILLGSLKNTELYLNQTRYEVDDMDNICIISYKGELTFMMKTLFLYKLKTKLKFDVIKYVVKQRYLRRGFTLKVMSHILGETHLSFNVLILDLSGVTHLDSTGCDCLTEVCLDFSKIYVLVLIAGLTGENYSILKRYREVYDIDYEYLVFPTTQDAVVFAKDNVSN